MNSESEKLGILLRQLREAYAKGENAMALARKILDRADNDPVATLLAYDLQTGNYVRWAKGNQVSWNSWCEQLAGFIRRILPEQGTVLEVGCGECMTMAGVLKNLATCVQRGYGFDISWSRVNEGRLWMQECQVDGTLFVADLFRIPMADNSIDVVYSSHSLEPNGGREEQAIRECLRVAKSYVLLIEPVYELAGVEQQKRMTEHGYVRGLRDAALQAGADVLDYRLLDYSINPMNPSGVLLLKKKQSDGPGLSRGVEWQCPLTSAPMQAEKDVFRNESLGLVYPVLREIPMLRPEHVIVASKLI